MEIQSLLLQNILKLFSYSVIHNAKYAQRIMQDMTKHEIPRSARPHYRMILSADTRFLQLLPFLVLLV